MDDSSDSEAGYSPLDFVSPPRANRAVRDAAPAPVMETPRHQIIRPYRPQYERPVQVPPSIAPPSAMWTQQTGGGDSVPYTITPVQAAARSISRPQQGSSVRHPELRSQRVRGSVRTGGSTRPRPTPAASEASSQPAANPSAFFANAVLKKQAKGAKNRPASQKKPTPAPPQPAPPSRQHAATHASSRRPPAAPASSVFSPEARRLCDTPVMGGGGGVAPSYVSSPTVASLASVDLQGRYARDASLSLPAAGHADAAVVATPASGISIHFDVSDDDEDEANVKMQRPATAPAAMPQQQQQNSPTITEILARGITESPEAQGSTAAPSLPSTGGGTSLRPSTFMRRRYSGGVPRPAKRVCRRAIDMSDDDDDDDDDNASNDDARHVASSSGGDVPSTPAPATSVVATAATSFRAADTTATECGTSAFEGDDYAVSTPSSMLTETTNSAALSPPGSSLTRPTLPTTSEAAAAAATAAEATSRVGAATVATSRMAVGGTKKSVAWDSEVDAASLMATTHRGAGGGGGGGTTTGAAASTYLPSPSLLEGEGVGGCMSAMSGHTDLSALQYTPVSCASQDLLGCAVTSYGGAASTVPPELSISARATMQKGSTVRGALSSYLPSPSLLGVAGDEQATTAPFTPGSVAPPSAMPWSETAASVRPAKRAKGKKSASSRAAATASDLASQFGGVSYNVALAPKGRGGGGGMLPPAFSVAPQTPSLLREMRGGSVATSVGRSSMKSGATAASAAADSTFCFTPVRKGAPMKGPTGAFKSLKVKMSQSEEDEWKEESGAWVDSFNAYIQECQKIEL